MKLKDLRVKLATDYMLENGGSQKLKAAYEAGFERAIVEVRRKSSYFSLVNAIINVILNELIVYLHLKLLEKERDLKS